MKYGYLSQDKECNDIHIHVVMQWHMYIIYYIPCHVKDVHTSLRERTYMYTYSHISKSAVYEKCTAYLRMYRIFSLLAVLQFSLMHYYKVIWDLVLLPVKWIWILDFVHSARLCKYYGTYQAFLFSYVCILKMVYMFIHFQWLSPFELN